MKDFQSLRIVFMGTPEFAVASLDALVKAGCNIVGVITAPDKPTGRGMELQQSAVLKIVNNKIQLKYLNKAYKLFPEKDSFFLKNNFINKLAGNDILVQQIKAGKTEAEIKKSWEPAITAFKTTRKKYLLYKDFE